MDGNGDLALKKDMPVMVTGEVVIFAEDGAQKIVSMPTTLAFDVNVVQPSETIPMTAAIRSELHGGYIIFPETRDRGATAMLMGQAVTNDVMTHVNPIRERLFTTAMLAGQAAAAVLGAWVNSSRALASELFKKEGRANSIQARKYPQLEFTGIQQTMSAQIEQYYLNVQRGALSAFVASAVADQADGATSFTSMTAPSFTTTEHEINANDAQLTTYASEFSYRYA